MQTISSCRRHGLSLGVSLPRYLGLDSISQVVLIKIALASVLDLWYSILFSCIMVTYGILHSFSNTQYSHREEQVAPNKSDINTRTLTWHGQSPPRSIKTKAGIPGIQQQPGLVHTIAVFKVYSFRTGAFHGSATNILLHSICTGFSCSPETIPEISSRLRPATALALGPLTRPRG